MEIIPSIDLLGGRVVRLEQGDYARETRFDRAPAELARDFVAAGVDRIHVVDLDGAREGRGRNTEIVQAILRAAGKTPVQVGGGVRSRDAVEQLLELGADRVVMGTAALENPELVQEVAEHWPGRLVLGLDTRGGQVAVRGWERVEARTPGEVLEGFAGLPFGAVLHTEIGRDGMLEGPDVAGTEALARTTALPVIASGGVGRLEDLLELARTRVIAGAIVGRAFYEGRIDLARAVAEVAGC